MEGVEDDGAGEGRGCSYAPCDGSGSPGEILHVDVLVLALCH